MVRKIDLSYAETHGTTHCWVWQIGIDGFSILAHLLRRLPNYESRFDQ